MSGLRISFVLPLAERTGGTRVIAAHAAELQQRGHTVFAVSQPRHRPSLRSRALAVIRGEWGVGEPRREESFMDDVDVPHVVLPESRPVEDRDLPEADVVIATWWETAEWVARLSDSKGAKAHFIQGWEVGDMWPGIPVERSRAVWRLPMHRIAVSRWLARMGREQFGCEQVDVVPNAIDRGQFDAPPRSRSACGTIGFVWSASPFKACEVAVKAAELVRERITGVKCVVFGQSDRPADLPEWMTYHAMPRQSRIPELYATADVWLWPSRFEGFGLPILEAMACRTPVVATPAGAAPELIEPGGGVLVKQDDTHAMAHAALGLLTGPEAEWRRASDLAYATASAHSWQRSTDLFERSLATAASGTRRATIASMNGRV